jgi:hypothetical protein
MVVGVADFPPLYSHPVNALTGSSHAPNIRLMTKRAVRIVKHLGSVPCVATCTACGEQFTAPLATLRRVTDAQANLQRTRAPDELDFESQWNVPG